MDERIEKITATYSRHTLLGHGVYIRNDIYKKMMEQEFIEEEDDAINHSKER